MGNIRPAYIKTIGEALIRRYGSEFSSSFEHNKRKVEELTTIKSKHIRNRVAGYITRKLGRASGERAQAV
ncbi:30S ribosomal protein S17e [Methermicoccus shengliensis]|uniref:Small ribosomal subunit protein eS17 n=1 Tax=Methermicoccus shengliensis TaxID=660064 RepID=A0A832VZR0_9EURY|nr:30S ribosomal protein S17e [Methermicoccus shengliensis]KUK05264.1 MAG: 30S ribosomal protein S17e [Euryarchaeota archaeon 55_53]KUK30321.1 MAG: 30S ribosomal protein S17e [Methanosarcinales archeaon 56_1174]MDI3487851.1 small subunit ribosomal protein S17e [Methanosarcinales archaeon]MDN5294502.1 small subunit ribosomal protein S17e [Methanosarcinales archaeon]HIH69769.1 30S ribosomal protein S17e [Methermicoccus shengliensis]